MVMSRRLIFRFSLGYINFWAWRKKSRFRNQYFCILGGEDYTKKKINNLFSFIRG